MYLEQQTHRVPEDAAPLHGPGRSLFYVCKQTFWRPSEVKCLSLNVRERELTVSHTSIVLRNLNYNKFVITSLEPSYQKPLCQGTGEKFVLPTIHSVPSGKVYWTSLILHVFGSFFFLYPDFIHSPFSFPDYVGTISSLTLPGLLDRGQQAEYRGRVQKNQLHWCECHPAKWNLT